MSNSMSDDYFSFMSRKVRGTPSAGRTEVPVKRAGTAGPPAPAVTADTIDFVDDSQIEVTESFVSDTLIQRLFRGCGNA